jgi:probable rRNA maturation factor
MVEVVNRQRRTKISSDTWVELGRRIIEAIGKPDATATIAFVSDTRIRQLNRQFRGVDKATDVLSFPEDNDSQDDNLGDIAISVDTALRQAKEAGLTFDNEVAQLMLHGFLHLAGYDHETDNGEMNRMELRLRKKLGI